MRAPTPVRLTLALLAALLPSAGAQQAPSQPVYDAFVQTTAFVAMRDGVKLATDVYVPTLEGKPAGRLPVLLVRTPYNKNGARTQAAALTRRGYVVVAQDVRGRYGSEGEFYPFVNEGKDGYDAIEWAAAQPWSNGQVGTFGSSYVAWDQYHAAIYRPPHLAALFAVVGGSRFYDEYAYSGGIPSLRWALGILSLAAAGQEAASKPELAARLSGIVKKPQEWYAIPSARRGDVLRELPAYHQVYRDYLAHPRFDAYWKQRGFFTAGYYREMKDVPMFFLTGWYDYFAEGTLEIFATLSRTQKTPKKLLVGPWPHSTGQPTCGDVAFGPGASLTHPDLMADWFDHCLRGREFRWKEPVRIFRMGGGGGERRDGKLYHGGEWQTAAAWPPPGRREVRYYLRPGGALSTAAPGSGEPSAYEHDPARPVPTVGGRYEACAQNQVCTADRLACQDTLPLDRRPDVLSFVSEPLGAAAEVTGRGTVRLFAASDAPSADFILKLIDVYPDGYALILAEGQVRASLTPGAVRRLEIPLESTSNWFAAGHRIRVDIASSSFPHNEVNPLKSRNRVFHDAGRASYVQLPVR